MQTALIFAGGTGRRMNARSKPKQFLELHGKPIIISTLEHFEYHEEIHNIAVVCIEGWIKELEGLLKRYGITKVKTIVPGGETGQERASEDHVRSIDSSHLCSLYHKPMHLVTSTKNNIKITEPADFYIYRAIYEAVEGQQIFGI